MTLWKFRRLLKKIDPDIRIRVAGVGDKIGIFSGRFGRSGYIMRMSKGELNLHGYRHQIIDPMKPWEKKQGN